MHFVSYVKGRKFEVWLLSWRQRINSLHWKDKGHKNIREEAYAGNCVPLLSYEKRSKAVAID